MSLYDPEPDVPDAVGSFLLTREVIEAMNGGPITDLEGLDLFRAPNRGLILTS